ncbi:hypothetical protein ACUN9Y_02075 [Halomonas sp. V046]|uniref:hypothetical protein n=1 Tax=Halomonas sp. V046 TaxID=3459611 RepID=UPI0040444727
MGVPVTDAEFDDHIDHQVGDRAKASEMEHAVRSHVRKHLDEDPIKYGRLSECREELLRDFVVEKRTWIYRKLAQKAEQRRRRPERPA